MNDVHAKISEDIISAMESCEGKGRSLWDRQCDLPMNLLSRKPYTGINTVHLWASSLHHEYGSPFWLTYKQAQELGGQVRAGEHGTSAVFYKQVPDKDPEDDAMHMILKSFTVFNLAQIDGIENPEEKEKTLFEILADGERLLEKSPVTITEGGNRAYYRPSTDEICLPPRAEFVDRESFYSTAAHEMIHSTGHASRLDRDLKGRFGESAYAMEELVAELGSAFLCAGIGIHAQTRQDHAHYLKSWIRILKEDKKAIFTASSAASKAASFITAKAA